MQSTQFSSLDNLSATQRDGVIQENENSVVVTHNQDSDNDTRNDVEDNIFEVDCDEILNEMYNCEADISATFLNSSCYNNDENYDYGDVENDQDEDNNDVNDNDEQSKNIDYANTCDDDFYDQPIYDGASISLKQSMLLVLRLSLKHKLTDSCTADILSVIRFHCSNQSAKKFSMYHFKKCFNIKNNSYTKHYYCSKCFKTADNIQSICDDCNQSSSQHFFARLSIVDQLQMILNKNTYLDLIKSRPREERNNINCIEELYDGKVYHEQFENNFISNSEQINISLTWCTDGVPIFKSSKKSAWPFYLRINELPFKLRIKRENTILAGLWYGFSKPSPNLFLKTMESEFESLYQGVQMNFKNSNTLLTVRALLLFGTCDLPAKSLFLNITQYNGEYGCPACECTGTNFEMASGRSLRVFPFVENYTERSLNQTLLYAQEALNNKLTRTSINQKTSVKGIKGPSLFSRIMPDYIKGM